MPKWIEAIGIGLLVMLSGLVLFVGLLALASIWTSYFTIGVLCLAVLAIASAIGHAVMRDDWE